MQVILSFTFSYLLLHFSSFLLFRLFLFSPLFSFSPVSLLFFFYLLSSFLPFLLSPPLSLSRFFPSLHSPLTYSSFPPSLHFSHAFVFRFLHLSYFLLLLPLFLLSFSPSFSLYIYVVFADTWYSLQLFGVYFSKLIIFISHVTSFHFLRTCSFNIFIITINITITISLLSNTNWTETQN